MKYGFLLLLAVMTLQASAQNYITTANQCYTDKNYKCAVENYKKALDGKLYKEADYPLIASRIGYGCMQENNFTEAVKYLKESVRAKPQDNGSSWWNLGWCQYSSADYDGAIASYDKAKEAYGADNTSLSKINREQGMVFYVQKQYTKAAAAYKEALRLDAGNVDAAGGLANSLYSTRQYAEAVQVYDRTLELAAGKESGGYLGDVHFWKAKALAAQGLQEKALGSYEMAIALDSTNDNAYALAGDIAQQLKYNTTGIKYLSRSIEIGNPDKKAMAVRYYIRGKCYSNLKEYAAATADFNKALEINPDYKDPHWDLAAVKYNERKYPEALAGYTKCIQLYQSDSFSLARLYYWRGDTYRTMKDYTRAMADYNSSINYDAGYGHAVWGKATLMKEREKYKEAIPFYTQALEKLSSTTSEDDLVFWRGFCYLNTGDTAKAISDFKKSIQINPNLADPNREMGHISFLRRQYQEADYYYNKSYIPANKEVPAMAAIWLRKGIANLMLNKSYQALTDLRTSLKCDSSDATTYRYLGEANTLNKNYTAAKADFTKAISLYRSNKDSLAKVYGYRAAVHGLLKQYDEALTDYEQASKLQPAQKNYIVETGKYAFELKQYGKAKDIYTRLIKAYQPAEKAALAYAHYARGRAAYELNEKQQAAADFSKALEYVPDYAEAKQWLQATKNAGQ